MQSILSAERFHNEEAAYEFVEARLWPDGPVCPHCGATKERVGRLRGKTNRPGLCKCYACRKPFTVKIGTVFESSHVPMRVWLQAIYLFCSSKKGISTRQLQRTFNCGLKTAWFLGHRVREAMKDLGIDSDPIGGVGKVVEADETFLTNSPKTRRKAGPLHARSSPQVMSLVERGGPIRSVFLDHTNVRGVLWRHLDRDSRLYTDGAVSYKGFMPGGQHESVDHSKGEYVRGDVHTNTLEGFFSIFKRGLIGVYQHVDEKHLDRYLAEFDFRFNHRIKMGFDDEARADRALVGVTGKRLTYATPSSGRTLAPPF
jgi:transposase-like protein